MARDKDRIADANTVVLAHSKLREQVPMFHDTSYAEVSELLDREALGGFRRASNGLYTREAKLYSFRPSCIEAGGETMTREMRR